ncbi:hypothetical protein WJ966_02065 [Achromobacter xylosoxidans]
MKSILQSEKYLLLACLVAVAGYAVDPAWAITAGSPARSRRPCWSRPSWRLR